VQHKAIFTTADHGLSNSTFSMTLNDPKPRFQGCAVTLNISEMVQDTDIVTRTIKF